MYILFYLNTYLHFHLSDLRSSSCIIVRLPFLIFVIARRCGHSRLLPKRLLKQLIHRRPLKTQRLLKTKLREHALILRQQAESLRNAAIKEDTVIATLRAQKEELMREIYLIMTATLGVPPNPNKRFVWEYIDQDEKTGRWEGSPKEYFEQFGTKPHTVRDIMLVETMMVIGSLRC